MTNKEILEKFNVDINDVVRLTNNGLNYIEIYTNKFKITLNSKCIWKWYYYNYEGKDLHGYSQTNLVEFYWKRVKLL